MDGKLNPGLANPALSAALWTIKGFVSNTPVLGRFWLDPGWPYLLAGILMLLAAGLIPSQLELEEREANVMRLRAEYAQLDQLRSAYSGFLDAISRGEQSLVERLAAAQLGIVPADRIPIAVTTGLSDPPTRWIERAAASVPIAELQEQPPATQAGESILARFVEGSGRLWLFGAALISIFAGLLLGPSQRPEPDQPLVRSQ